MRAATVDGMGMRRFTLTPLPRSRVAEAGSAEPGGGASHCGVAAVFARVFCPPLKA